MYTAKQTVIMAQKFINIHLETFSSNFIQVELGFLIGNVTKSWFKSPKPYFLELTIILKIGINNNQINIFQIVKFYLS